MLLLLIKTIFQPVLNGTMKLGILFTVVYTWHLVFSKIQEILLAHIAIISDSPTLHWDTNNQNLSGDKDYRSDPPPGYPISPLDGCYAETQAGAGCQLTRLSRHKPQTFATLPGIWHSWYLADNQLISGLWSLPTHFGDGSDGSWTSW